MAYHDWAYDTDFYSVSYYADWSMHSPSNCYTMFWLGEYNIDLDGY